MIDKNKYINKSQDELDEEFRYACRDGELELIKYLITSSDLTTHANINMSNNSGIMLACANGHLDTVKYLLILHNFRKQTSINSGFKMACINGHLNIINFLIFDYNFEKTEVINNFLKDYPSEEIEKMFNVRNLKNNLNNKLEKKEDNKIKTKI